MSNLNQFIWDIIEMCPVNTEVRFKISPEMAICDVKGSSGSRRCISEILDLAGFKSNEFANTEHFSMVGNFNLEQIQHDHLGADTTNPDSVCIRISF
jgi:hypothetical protein